MKQNYSIPLQQPNLNQRIIFGNILLITLTAIISTFTTTSVPSPSVPRFLLLQTISFFNLNPFYPL